MRDHNIASLFLIVHAMDIMKTGLFGVLLKTFNLLMN